MTIPRWVWPALALGLSVVAGVFYVNHLRGRADEAEQERDREALRAAGANAVAEVSRSELKKETARLEKENALLAAELERVRGALPGARPAGTLAGGTGPLAPTGPGVVFPLVLGADGQAQVPCLLTANDRLDLRVVGVALVGDSGAIGVAAVAQAWRVGEPPVLLAEGPLHLDVKMRDLGELPGWGAGAVIVGGRAGWWAGPIVSPPPLRLWGLEASLLVGAGVGPAGDWGGLAGGLLRW